MRHRILLGLVSLFMVGCVHAQVAVSKGQSFQLTWTASPSCTAQSPCPSHVISRAQVATAATPCPSITATNYAPVGTASTSNATSYLDSSITATGFYCYIVQAQQGSPLSTGSPSQPSNNGAAGAITEPPIAPTALQGNTQ